MKLVSLDSLPFNLRSGLISSADAEEFTEKIELMRHSIRMEVDIRRRTRLFPPALALDELSLLLQTIDEITYASWREKLILRDKSLDDLVYFKPLGFLRQHIEDLLC